MGCLGEGRGSPAIPVQCCLVEANDGPECRGDPSWGGPQADHANADRYREYYSFPGVDLNAIAARSYVKALGEWDLPPVKFRRVGNPLVYANWVRFAVFSSGLAANRGGAERVGYVNAGAQMNVRVVLFTYLNTTFSAGYAAAVDRNGRLSREYMISLKIL